jgi:hypothetical protein
LWHLDNQSALDKFELLDPGRQLLLVDLVRLAHIQGAH